MDKKQQIRIKKKWKNSEIRISKYLRDIIHGYMISDGYIPRNSGCLYVQHSNKQEKFVLWLYNKMKLIRTSYPIQTKIQIHSKTKKQTTKVCFNTRNILQGFRYMWYKDEIDEKTNKYSKKLPNSIDGFFNETFISVWFAGNGTKIINSRGAKFEVTALSVQDRLKLKFLFLKKFNIKTQIISSGISSKGTSQWALKIPASEYSKFRKLIIKEDLIPTLFAYKLHKNIEV